MKKVRIIVIILIITSIIFTCWKFYKPVLKKIYPKQYSEYVEKYAEENEINPLWVYSIIKAESNFKEDAKSNCNAIGLMQIMLTTAEEIVNEYDTIKITEEELWKPEINIKVGTKYFKNLLDKYGNYKLALIAYNAGMGNLDNWLENGIINPDGNNIEDIPFKETKDYVKRILQNYNIYSQLY